MCVVALKRNKCTKNRLNAGSERGCTLYSDQSKRCPLWCPSLTTHATGHTQDTPLTVVNICSLTFDSFSQCRISSWDKRLKSSCSKVTVTQACYPGQGQRGRVDCRIKQRGCMYKVMCKVSGAVVRSCKINKPIIKNGSQK